MSNLNQLYFVALVLQQQRMKFLSLLSLTKAVRKKRHISQNEGDEGPATIANDRDCKRKRQNPEIQDNPDLFDLIINYFVKCFEKKGKKVAIAIQ